MYRFALLALLAVLCPGWAHASSPEQNRCAPQAKT
jgi:hypothetical protein